ncbi:MAG: DsbA family protein [Cocleimonas sp.]|nr:DsbA family protein [Cocleimonas sp.]
MESPNHKENKSILFYIHDPMCSWCWGFRKTWLEIQQKLVGKIPVAYLAGGLASDSDEPMSESMQLEIQGYWHKVQQHIPVTAFNFEFWTNNQARRSTYIACRATIAARRQNAEKEMLYAIQQAYYLKAKNPSDSHVLIDLAVELGLDVELFTERLNHPETQQRLLAEICYGQHLGAQGFPSLVFQHDKTNHFIAIDYNNADVSLQAIAQYSGLRL